VYAYADSDTHCIPEEHTYFSCRIPETSDVASLCSNYNIYRSNIPSDMWLEYRWGPINSPKLIYPANKNGSLSAFTGELNYHHDSSHGGQDTSEATVVFQILNTVYSLERNSRGESTYLGMSQQNGLGAWQNLSCTNSSGNLDAIADLLQIINPE
jgi:hypothetical protein